MNDLNDSKKIVIAIDGPAGSGKSTIAKLLAERMKIQYIDSGAIYRSLTLHWIQIHPENQTKDLEKVAGFFKNNPEKLQITYKNHTQVMVLDGRDISAEIRTPDVTRQIKHIANHVKCREVVDQKMRQIAHNYPVVIDGRDIGTVVFPDTNYKFYLDAKADTRARRRALDLNIPPDGEAFNVLLAEIIERDRSDMSRKIAPLRRHPDAILIDTSSLTVDEVLQRLEQEIEGKSSNPN